MDTAASEDSGYQVTASQGYAIPIGTALSIAKKIEAGDTSSTIHIGATGFLGCQRVSRCQQHQWLRVTAASAGSGFGGSGRYAARRRRRPRVPTSKGRCPARRRPRPGWSRAM